MGKDTDYVTFEGIKVKKSIYYKTCKNGKTVEENAKAIIVLHEKMDAINGSMNFESVKKKRAQFKALKKESKGLLDIIRQRIKDEAEYEKTILKEGRYKIAQITKRKCGKLQPEVKVGKRYFIVGRDKTRTGADVVILADFEKAGCGGNIPAIRCNSKRFEWKEMTQTEATVEQMSYYKPVLNNLVNEYVSTNSMPSVRPVEDRECDDVSLIMRECSTEEQMKISLIPLVIYNLSWEYAFMALDQAAKERVSLLKSLSRSVKKINDDYIYNQRKELDYRRYCHLLDQTTMCHRALERDLSILFFSVNNEFKRCVPDYPHDVLRTYAIISQILFSFALKWNKDTDVFLARKFPKEHFEPTVMPPEMKKLYHYMEGIAGVGEKFNYLDNNIVTSMCVIENRMKHIEFSAV